jgi:uncharacterized protein
MQEKFIILASVFIISTLTVSCTYSKAMQADPDADIANPLAATIQLYQGPLNHLAAVRSGECPMYPSDSEYGLQSIRKHGIVIGWIMTMDRLMRCGRDETRLAPAVRIEGKLKHYDPLVRNDFWWSGEELP